MALIWMDEISELLLAYGGTLSVASLPHFVQSEANHAVSILRVVEEALNDEHSIPRKINIAVTNSTDLTPITHSLGSDLYLIVVPIGLTLP